MMIEVEVKLPIANHEELAKKLVDKGFALIQKVRETDTYYTSHFHDMRKLDEALRVREIELLDGDEIKKKESVITYKGAKLDSVSMARKELETGIEDASVLKQILESIGFFSVPSVKKIRCSYECGRMHACLDEVTGLGYYLELEIIDKENQHDEALREIEDMLNALGYGMEDTTRNSYLSMLMGINDSFYHRKLTDSDKKRMLGKSYPQNTKAAGISWDDLAYVEVLHYDFNNEIQRGELVCNRKIADDLLEVFMELFEARYQIEKIRLIDEYAADDLISMADNNSSAFNYRVISGTDIISNHGYGLAIDINPLYNPYVFTRNGKYQVQPENAEAYVDRTNVFSHKISHDDLCYKIFTRHGFSWGGDWEDSKDYQHFEKIL